MSSSRRSASDRPRPLDELPAALPSMWRAVKRGFAAEPALLAIAFVLSLLAALPDALMALWLKFLADGLLGGMTTLVGIAAAGLAVSATLTWVLRVVSERTQRRFRDRVTIALESHVAELQASVVTVEHHERPDYLDRLSILRDQVFVLDHMYMSLFTTCGWILRLVVTIALLVSIHPLLATLALFALPTVATSSWRPAVERAAEEAGAQAQRLAKHLFDIATTAPPGKEVRVSRIGGRLVRDRRAAWERWYARVAPARWGSAAWHTAGWAVFAAGYVGAVVFVAAVVDASPGEVLLVLAAGSRLSAYISATVGEIGFLRGIWMDGSKRLAWLEDYAAAKAEHADRPVPDAIGQGISLENVSFAYPGTDKLVLKDIDLELPAGAVVALVGENGAGKTTLVKLLAKMYEPSTGRILVDGAELARMPAMDWRERLAGTFQDFFRFEFQAQRTVGLGDAPRVEERPAVRAAVVRAGAEDVVQSLANGLDTQLGPTWPDGVEVSFGQWQKLSLARGFMRDEPLLLVLDEPTAALDAETEHALFERYADAAKERTRDGAANNGRITVLVSHRFSTVRMADLIVVMDGARVVEVGSHEQLMAAAGQYAELYGIQAAAYR
ncbi:MAG: ABC transporter ATP-binding protein [Gammaproteobacteria bacterium]|nr:ABC transporter ATP-binding protein [Gammaproteobacteria bacterium]